MAKTYRELLEALKKLPKADLDKHASVVINDARGTEVAEITDLVGFGEPWPEAKVEPYTGEFPVPTAPTDYDLMLVEDVIGVLDDNHPYMTVLT